MYLEPIAIVKELEVEKLLCSAKCIYASMLEMPS